MKLPFYKYQGTGNDFIIIDNRDLQHLSRKDVTIIQQLCDRRFGIGADGLILLQNHINYDFEMVYFNADGTESSMCGNGGRCIVAFAKFLKVIEKDCRFLAVDGEHEAKINDTNWVELKMSNVENIEKAANYTFMNTGSPHYVTFVENVETLNIFEEGRKIRYAEPYKTAGTNVNFVEQHKEGISVATYERGVENETLSCGTGVTAAALAYFLQQPDQTKHEVNIKTKGGQLKVKFCPQKNGFSDIWLCGPTQQVFKGEIALSNNVA